MRNVLLVQNGRPCFTQMTDAAILKALRYDRTTAILDLKMNGYAYETTNEELNWVGIHEIGYHSFDELMEMDGKLELNQ